MDPDRVLEGDFLRWILLVGGRDAAIVEMARENIRPEQLHVQPCAKIYQTYVELYDKGLPRDLIALIEEPQDQEFIEELLQKRVPLDRVSELFPVTIQKILDRNWMEQREEIRRKIQSGTCSDEEVMLLMKQFDELKRSQPKRKETEASNREP